MTTFPLVRVVKLGYQRPSVMSADAVQVPAIGRRLRSEPDQHHQRGARRQRGGGRRAGKSARSRTGWRLSYRQPESAAPSERWLRSRGPIRRAYKWLERQPGCLVATGSAGRHRGTGRGRRASPHQHLPSRQDMRVNGNIWEREDAQLPRSAWSLDYEPERFCLGGALVGDGKRRGTVSVELQKGRIVVVISDPHVVLDYRAGCQAVDGDA